MLPRREPLGEIQAPEDAARAFRAEVLRAARSLSEEYAAMFTGAPAETDAEPDGAARRRKRLVFELNRSGKYHDMKERLKDAASKIVKSRFFARSAVRPDDREELDAIAAAGFEAAAFGPHILRTETAALVAAAALLRAAE